MDFGLHGKNGLGVSRRWRLGTAISEIAGQRRRTGGRGRHWSGFRSGTRQRSGSHRRQKLGLVWDLADLAQIDGQVSKVESELGPVEFW